MIDRDWTIILPLDTDYEDQLLFGGNVEGTILLSQTGKADLLALLVTVLLHILLGTFEDDTALLLLGLSKDVSCEARVKSKIHRKHRRDNSDPKDG